MRKRPSKLVGKLRSGCDLTIKEEFELWLYIRDIEKANKEYVESIDKVRATMSSEMSKLWSKYEEDPANVPKPDLMSAVALVEIVTEKLKENYKGN